MDQYLFGFLKYGSRSVKKPGSHPDLEHCNVTFEIVQRGFVVDILEAVPSPTLQVVLLIVLVLLLSSWGTTRLGRSQPNTRHFSARQIYLTVRCGRDGWISIGSGSNKLYVIGSGSYTDFKKFDF